MTDLAVRDGEPFVGAQADEVLQDDVLVPLRRPRIGLDPEDLLPDQAGEQGLEIGLGTSGDRRQGGDREGPSQDGGVLQERTLVGVEAVEALADEGLQGLRHVQGPDRPGRAVGAAFLHEQAAIEQHANGLDRVQRDALGSLENPGAQV
jgi:hypothetical protein